MPIVQFTSNLKRFYPNLYEVQVEAKTIAQLVDCIDLKYPGIKKYIVDDQNMLRHHVNIFINESMISDRVKLHDKIDDHDKVYIMQALSGG